MQPLAGLLVLDFSTLLPGPLATLMLAEAGAEVIKIEQPGGENARRFPPGTVEDRDLEPAVEELVGSRQPGYAGTDHGNSGHAG